VWLAALAIAAALLGREVASARGVETERGEWPENWPKELEPFREQASSISYGFDVWTQYYIITFRTREEFEAVWPVLLKLKSAGAPLCLRTPDAPKTDVNDPAVVRDRPQVWIVCPVPEIAKYELQPNGEYRLIAPWSDSAVLDKGVLAERVVKRKADGKWVVWEDNGADGDFILPAHQARVQLTLYVDGEVVDLNRIPLPKDTPILDERKLSPNR
jgi:hypothetical protein